MSDSRYLNGIYQGAPLTRQQALNRRHQDFFSNHPASYGWTAIKVNPENGLVIWERDGALLQRHPAGDCWLLFWAQCWQPVDLHISELSENLVSLKLTIEFEIDKEQFTADVEKLAA